jgi:hypothetical protein
MPLYHFHVTDGLGAVNPVSLEHMEALRAASRKAGLPE